MKNFFLGILTIIIIQGILILGLFFLYKQDLLNSTINQYFGLGYEKNETIKSEKEIQIDFTETETENLSGITIINEDQNNIKYVENKYIKNININNITIGSYIYDNINNQFNEKKITKKANLILFFFFTQDKDDNIKEYYLKHIKKIIKKEDIYNKIKQNINDIEKIQAYLIKNKTDNFKKFLKQEQKIFNSKEINNHYCFEDYCQKYPEEYNYVKKAIINNKGLRENIAKYSKQYNIPENVFYSILIIENLRMHLTNKTTFKSVFVKYNIPQLGIMTKFSYGMYGMKMDVLDKIIESNQYNNNKHIKKLKEIKDDKKRIDYIVKNKDFQTEFVGMFLDYQRNLYKDNNCDKIGNDIGLLTTLWNIGGTTKEKLEKCNPDTGGSKLAFANDMYFGDLARIIDDSLDLFYIKNR